LSKESPLVRIAECRKRNYQLFSPKKAPLRTQWQIRGSLENPVRGLEFDSRRVEKGIPFCSLLWNPYGWPPIYPRSSGCRGHGDSSQPGSSEYLPEITYLQVPDTRRAFSLLSAAFYEHPSKALPTIGITGTDGKSTTVSFLHQLLTLGVNPQGLSPPSPLIQEQA
jgi:hypothetical protein